MLVEEWKILEGRRHQRKAAAVASVTGVPAASGANIQAIDLDIDNRVEVTLARYNERAKDYHWRAQALLQQAQTLLTPVQLAEAQQIFVRLSGNFKGLNGAVEVLSAYSEVHESLSGLVSAIQVTADSKLRIRQNPRN